MAFPTYPRLSAARHRDEPALLAGSVTTLATPQPPVPVWQGRPSGAAFAEMLRGRAEQVGVPVEVGVQPWSHPGSYGVDADWGEAPDAGFSCEVADWVDGVRLLDSSDADVTVAQALAYFEGRLQGRGIRDAMVRRQRASFLLSSAERSTLTTPCCRTQQALGRTSSAASRSISSPSRSSPSRPRS